MLRFAKGDLTTEGMEVCTEHTEACIQSFIEGAEFNTTGAFVSARLWALLHH
jgi:hypothetical protein